MSSVLNLFLITVSMVLCEGSTSITWDMLFSKSISLDSLWVSWNVLILKSFSKIIVMIMMRLISFLCEGKVHLFPLIPFFFRFRRRQIVRPIFQYSLSLESPMYTFTKSSIIVNSLPSVCHFGYYHFYYYCILNFFYISFRKCLVSSIS